MKREWKCILAGGAHHLEIVTLLTDFSMKYPMAQTLSDGRYNPMTMTAQTSGVPPFATGACVLAHANATLEDINAAHEVLISTPC